MIARCEIDVLIRKVTDWPLTVVMLHPSRDSDNAMVSGHHHLAPGDYRHLWDEMNGLITITTLASIQTSKDFQFNFSKTVQAQFYFNGSERF